MTSWACRLKMICGADASLPGGFWAATWDQVLLCCLLRWFWSVDDFGNQFLDGYGIISWGSNFAASPCSSKSARAKCRSCSSGPPSASAHINCFQPQFVRCAGAAFPDCLRCLVLSPFWSRLIQGNWCCLNNVCRPPGRVSALRCRCDIAARVHRMLSIYFSYQNRFQ
jgi:hypothetical protein